jgi:hypothetical protein
MAIRRSGLALEDVRALRLLADVLNKNDGIVVVGSLAIATS